MEENNKFDNKSLKKVTGRTADLERMVRTMAKDGEITPIGGRKYRRYKLNEDSFLEKSGRK